MEALTHFTVTDSRQTVEAEVHYSTFEDLMSRVDAGEMTFDQAIERYRTLELGDTAIQAV